MPWHGMGRMKQPVLHSPLPTPNAHTRTRINQKKLAQNHGVMGRITAGAVILWGRTKIMSVVVVVWELSVSKCLPASRCPYIRWGGGGGVGGRRNQCCPVCPWGSNTNVPHCLGTGVPALFIMGTFLPYPHKSELWELGNR